MGNINKEKFILDAIKKNPGINRTKLCILLELEGCSSIGINKILETLKKHNIIYGKKDGRNIFYYDKERFLKDNPNFVETLEIKNEQELKQKKQEVLKQKKQEVLKQKKKEEFERLSKLEYNKNYMPTKQEKDIIKEIMINPNLSAKELAISLKMTQDNLSRKIAILRNNNIIYEIKVGVYVFYYVNENFLKDNPNFVETLEIKNEQELKQKKREELKQKKHEEIEILSKLEYNKNYIPTKQEKDIIKEIIINPNLSVKELAISLEMSQNNLSQKLFILRNNNIINGIKVGVYVFYYVNANFLKDNPNFVETLEIKNEQELKQKKREELKQKKHEEIEKLSKLEYNKNYIPTKKEKNIIKEIIINPNLSVKELAMLLKMTQYNLSQKLSILRNNNIIYGIKEERNVFYHINENFLKDNPNFLETLEIKHEQELMKKKREETEKLSKLEYNKNYIPTKQEKDIIKEIMINPNLSAKELAISLKMTQANLSQKLSILRNNNIIYGVKVRRNVFYYVNANFLKDNPDFVETLENKQENKNITEILIHIKTILLNSTIIHSKIILENFEFFLTCFSYEEFLRLLNYLDICKFEYVNKENEELETETQIKRELLTRYEDICFYFSNRYVLELKMGNHE